MIQYLRVYFDRVIAKSINLEKSFEPVISNNEIFQELEFKILNLIVKDTFTKG